MPSETKPYENVILVGGPCDGWRVSWRGGNRIEMAPAPVVSLLTRPADTPPPPLELGPKAATYLRSINTPELFVHQP